MTPLSATALGGAAQEAGAAAAGPRGEVGLQLLRPEWWPLVGVALAVVAAGAAGLVARRRERQRLVHPRQLERFFPGLAPGRAWARLALAGTATLLTVLALLGPVRGWTQREVVQKGLDIVFCIDTSRSMLARDLRPTRLERATREVIGLLDGLAGDRAALLAFSGDVREVAPLTHDRAVLAELAADITAADNRVGGTDLGAALERALALFDGRTGAHEAIVLLTDGEDLEGRGAEVARRAAEQGIRVYVVGVGTTAGGKIPIERDDGSEGFVRDAEGNEVITRLEGSSLVALAEITGGAYLSTENSPTPLEDLYRARISKLDARAIEGGLEWVPHDRFQWCLAVAFGCMLLEAGLRERRSPSARGAAAGGRSAGGHP